MAQNLFDIAMNNTVENVDTKDMWNIVNNFMMVSEKKIKTLMKECITSLKNSDIKEIYYIIDVYSDVDDNDEEGEGGIEGVNELKDSLIIVKLVSKNMGIDRQNQRELSRFYKNRMIEIQKREEEDEESEDDTEEDEESEDDTEEDEESEDDTEEDEESEDDD
jgi:hypothetical protein